MPKFINIHYRKLITSFYLCDLMSPDTSHKYVEDLFRGRFVNWMNEAIKDHNLRFEYVDQQLEIKDIMNGNRYFADIAIWDKKGQKIACIIELKVPFNWSPYDDQLITDAQNKAIISSPQVPYFGTWNTNEFVLWKTFDTDATSYIDRRLSRYDVVNITNQKDIDDPLIENKIKDFILIFLKDLEEIFYENKVITKIPIDEFFIYNLRSMVNLFYFPLSTEIRSNYEKDKIFRDKLRTWFVEQGWTPPSNIFDFMKISRQFLYLTIDKILFYNTLRITFKTLDPIYIDEGITDEKKIKEILYSSFRKAEDVTGDYETIFATNFLETMPIPSSIISNFIRFINGFSKHDFSKIGLKDIGRIFDSLIPSSDRHKLGQYFTRSDIVDLIIGFCIKNDSCISADFGCGAGTFLVRGYSRLKYLNPRKEHGDILEQLWGVDIAKFPAHLSMINLAIRDLSKIENYPRILYKDFFDIKLGGKYQFLPKEYAVQRLDRTTAKVEFPILDCVIGNPPYTRQEELEDYIPGYKEKIEKVMIEDWGVKINLGKRSSIYSYFFLHGLHFLKEGGRFGYIVSNSWLDVDYGKYLQEFFLNKTRIVAIIESKVERWFEDADINTVITILERCENKEELENNVVKFVQIKTPLEKIIQATDNEKKRWGYVDELVELIEKTNDLYEDEKLTIYPKLQSELWDEGYDDEEGRYVGSKWGKYLRAPDIFFKILKRDREILTPMNNIADVKFGIKTGANDFFYINDNVIDKWQIENEFWSKENNGEWKSNHIITSSKKINSIYISPKDLDEKVLIIDQDKKNLKGKKILRYIEWGEEQGFHKRPSCKHRNLWYQLPKISGPILSNRFIDKDFSFIYNPEGYYVGDTFFVIFPTNKDYSKLLCAILNTTLYSFLLELYGRTSLGDGLLLIYGPEIKPLPIINPEKISKSHKIHLEKAFDKISQRQIESIFNELGANSPDEVNLDNIKKDRRELDKIVMEDILGLDQTEQLEVYRSIIDLVKSRIERAKSVDKKKKYMGVDTEALARRALDDLSKDINIENLRFPDPYLEGIKYETKYIPKGISEVGRDLNGYYLQTSGEKIICDTKERAWYLHYCGLNRKEECKIPLNEKDIRRIVKIYAQNLDEFFNQLEQSLDDISDIKIKEKVKFEIMKKVFY